MTEYPACMILFNSTTMQIYPTPFHSCAVPNGENFNGKKSHGVFLQPEGDYLAWSCPRCKFKLIFDVQELLRPSSDSESNKPKFMPFNQWKSLSNASTTKAQIDEMVAAGIYWRLLDTRFVLGTDKDEFSQMNQWRCFATNKTGFSDTCLFLFLILSHKNIRSNAF